MTPSEKVVLSYKRFYFVKVLIFAEGEQNIDYCLSLTQDSQSESGESVKLIERFDLVCVLFFIRVVR